MIGKSQLNYYPESIQREDDDLMTSSVISIEGYSHCAVYTDDNLELQWAFRLKTKNEAQSAAKRWYAKTADINNW